MSNLEPVHYRRADPSDAEAVASLHADSWRRHYRGAYTDEFLDGDVAAERLEAWTNQFRKPRPDRCTIVAEGRDGIVGFAHVIFDADASWGALLENLHVRNDLRGRGVGTQLVASAAMALPVGCGSRGMYLWVLEQNTAAQRFYESRGGSRVERALAPPPGGDSERLAGAPMRCRYVWPDPSELMLWLEVH